MTNKERLLDKVVAQILEDIGNEDLTAIYELIEPLPTEWLEGFLSEKYNLWLWVQMWAEV